MTSTTDTQTRRRLGHTDLDIFPLNLGANVFDWTADRDATFAVLDAYRAAGGNFVDTADVYSNWVPGHTGGESETLLGEWLASRGCRDEFVVATKVGLGGPGLAKGLSAQQITRGCEGSLRRLGVERIDLFYAHRDDPGTPLAETVRAFDTLVRQGKVRVIGASNYEAERLSEALAIADREGLAGFAVLQPRYNLAVRDQFEGALADLCASRGIGVCAYSALASGFLTGKYRSGEKPTGERAGAAQRYLDDPGAVARLETARTIAARHGCLPAQVALAWLLQSSAVTAPIVSATSPAQVRELVAALDLRLDADDLARLAA